MELVKDPVGDTDSSEANRRIVERFWEAMDRHDVETVMQLTHPDLVMEWPQSGERFSGRDKALAAMAAQEQPPEIVGEPRLVGDGAVWVAMVPLRYGEEMYRYVGVFELRDGRIVRSTEHFGAPFPAPESRAQFADPQ